MSVANKTPLSERYKLDKYMDIIDDGAECSSCGETFKVGDEVIDVPFGIDKWICTIHLGCGINGGEIDLDT